MIQFDYSNIFQMGWNHQLWSFFTFPPPSFPHEVGIFWTFSGLMASQANSVARRSNGTTWREVSHAQKMAANLSRQKTGRNQHESTPSSPSVSHVSLLEDVNMDGTPKIVGFPSKSSILIGFSIINYQFLGSPILGNTHIESISCFCWWCVVGFEMWFMKPAGHRTQQSTVYLLRSMWVGGSGWMFIICQDILGQDITAWWFFQLRQDWTTVSCLAHLSEEVSWSSKLGLHPGRLTWNIIMGVGKMIFLSKWVIYRFHVNLPGCTKLAAILPGSSLKSGRPRPLTRRRFPLAPSFSHTCHSDLCGLGVLEFQSVPISTKGPWVSRLIWLLAPLSFWRGGSLKPLHIGAHNSTY